MLNFANAPAREENSSYARISRALLYLAENYRRQPSLNDAAGVAGLSPWHFQREFTRLTGISPKSFIGHLTLERAKRALLDGRSVLDASWSAGLSGPSRLHDLTLKIEAMSPGEYARRGADLTIFYGWRATLLGRALLAATERGLCGISFAADEEGPAQYSDMLARWPDARFVADDKFIDAYAEQIFFGQILVMLFQCGCPARPGRSMSGRHCSRSRPVQQWRMARSPAKCVRLVPHVPPRQPLRGIPWPCSSPATV